MVYGQECAATRLLAQRNRSCTPMGWLPPAFRPPIPQQRRYLATHKFDGHRPRDRGSVRAMKANAGSRRKAKSGRQRGPSV